MRNPRIGLLGRGMVVAALLTCCLRGWAQQLTANEIMAQVVERNALRLAALDAYTVDRVYHMEYTGIGGPRTAEIQVHTEYHYPGTKHFVVVGGSGSKVLCEKVLRKLVESEEEASEKNSQAESMLSTENYTAKLAGQEQVNGIQTWILDVTPKKSSKYTYRGKVWVSMDDFAIVRVLAVPGKSPSWMVHNASFDYQYQRIGMFWVPARNSSETHVLLGGEARLTISYDKYSIHARTDKPELAHAFGVKLP